MISIKKSRAGYRVIHSGKNGEPLCVSEVLTSLAAAKKNVRAMKEVYSWYPVKAHVKYNGKIILV